MNLDRRYLTVIITFFAASAVLIGGVLLWQYLTSFHQAAFTIKPANLTADIYQLDLSIPEDDEGKKVATVKNGQELRLQEGKYYAMVTDKKYDTSHIAFDVKEDVEVAIEPGYSDQYLSDLLKKEFPSIHKAILTKYPLVATDFTLQEGKLYLDGTWYGTTMLKHNPDPGGESSDVYSAVLHKVNGTWQFAATPQIALTKPSNPNIPARILDDLNEQ